MPPSDQEPAYRLVDPSTGDIVGSFYENGSGDVEIQPSDGTQYKFAQSPSDNVDVARLQDVPDNSIEVFKSDGTFDATGIDDAYIEVVGGGGGGGGTVDNGTDTVQAGASGGGGGYAASFVDLTSTSSVSITVGSGGGPTNNGGVSSFGTSVIGDGGTGGEAADDNRPQRGDGGGGTGDLVINGQDGGLGSTSTTSTTDPVTVYQVEGGESVLGSGGPGGSQIDTAQVGLDGTSPGGGGGGAANGIGSSTDLSGGAGADGIVIVRY